LLLYYCAFQHNVRSLRWIWIWKKILILRRKSRMNVSSVWQSNQIHINLMKYCLYHRRFVSFLDLNVIIGSSWVNTVFTARLIYKLGLVNCSWLNSWNWNAFVKSFVYWVSPRFSFGWWFYFLDILIYLTLNHFIFK
jgi:hypothetical protein